MLRIYLFHITLAQWVRCLASLWPTPRDRTQSPQDSTQTHTLRRKVRVLSAHLGGLWCIGYVLAQSLCGTSRALVLLSIQSSLPKFPLPAYSRWQIEPQCQALCKMHACKFKVHAWKRYARAGPHAFHWVLGSIPTQVRNEEVHSSRGLPEISQHLVSPLP